MHYYKNKLPRAIKKSSPWLKYLQEGPIKAAVAIILTVGGVILLLFCLRHDFMPQAGWETLATSLGAIALTGLFVTLLLIIAPLMPALYSIGNSGAWNVRRKPFDFGFAIGGVALFSLMVASTDTQMHGSWTLDSLYDAGRYVALCIISFTILVIGICRNYGALKYDKRFGLDHFVIFATATKTDSPSIRPHTTTINNIRAWLKDARLLCTHSRITDFAEGLSSQAGYVQMAIWWPTSLLIGTLIALISLPKPVEWGLAIYTVWVLLVVLVNYTIAKKHAEMKKMQVASLAAVPTIVLITAGTLFTNLIDAPFKMLGLGMIETDHITISNKYADALKREFGPFTQNPSGSQGINRLSCIISRIGGEYLIATDACNNYSEAIGKIQNRQAIVWLPGEAVLAWSRTSANEDTIKHEATKPVAHSIPANSDKASEIRFPP